MDEIRRSELSENMKAVGIEILELFRNHQMAGDPGACAIVLGGIIGALAKATNDPPGLLNVAMTMAHGVMSGDALTDEPGGKLDA